MIKIDSGDKKVRISVTLDPEIIKMIDNKTSNRSSLINLLIKKLFLELGEDVSKIKIQICY